MKSYWGAVTPLVGTAATWGGMKKLVVARTQPAGEDRLAPPEGNAAVLANSHTAILTLTVLSKLLLA